MHELPYSSCIIFIVERDFAHCYLSVTKRKPDS
nr:MAG TPA: hypothetical protein [Caudoviricetes sp.]DAT18757.1 MAG TPA: hypothetical protein [Caudoviricetes sp.]